MLFPYESIRKSIRFVHVFLLIQMKIFPEKTSGFPLFAGTTMFFKFPALQNIQPFLFKPLEAIFRRTLLIRMYSVVMLSMPPSTSGTAQSCHHGAWGATA